MNSSLQLPNVLFQRYRADSVEKTIIHEKLIAGRYYGVRGAEITTVVLINPFTKGLLAIYLSSFSEPTALRWYS